MFGRQRDRGLSRYLWLKTWRLGRALHHDRPVESEELRFCEGFAVFVGWGHVEEWGIFPNGAEIFAIQVSTGALNERRTNSGR